MTAPTIAYIRVSTDKQADKGFSLEAQRSKIETYAKLYDLDLVEIVEEAASAKTLDRPGFQKILTALREGRAKGVLVVKLDRLTRSVADLGSLLTDYFAPGKYDLFSVSEHLDTTTAAGRLVLNVLASVSQWEREAISERTKAALSVKKAKGERLGAPRYGFRVEVSHVDGEEVRTLVPVPEEQAVIQTVKELHASGLSQRKIASELNSRGYQSRGEGPFMQAQIVRILRAA